MVTKETVLEELAEEMAWGRVARLLTGPLNELGFLKQQMSNLVPAEVLMEAIEKYCPDGNFGLLMRVEVELVGGVRAKRLEVVCGAGENKVYEFCHDGSVHLRGEGILSPERTIELLFVADNSLGEVKRLALSQTIVGPVLDFSKGEPQSVMGEIVKILMDLEGVSCNGEKVISLKEAIAAGGKEKTHRLLREKLGL